MQNPLYVHQAETCSFPSKGSSWGYDRFVRKDALERSMNLEADCFTIRCDITIAGTIDLFIKVPPCSIQQHISDFLLFKEGTDVAFRVSGEMFAAHRCVLAARSAVFKAELYGPMRG